MKFLEWLLLADIPDRELRPDTRASFAAGQMSRLVPLLVHKADSWVDGFRELSSLRVQLETLQNKGAPPQNLVRALNEAIQVQLSKVERAESQHRSKEAGVLRRYFDLLLGAFAGFPTKARLFERLISYCRHTGYNGLQDVAAWITKDTSGGRQVWADYYTGLMMQALAQSIPWSIRKVLDTSALHAEADAALNHLSDIANLQLEFVSKDRRSWFHETAEVAFATNMLLGSAALASIPSLHDLTSRLERRSRALGAVGFDRPTSDWIVRTGYSAGTWAHQIESWLSAHEKPSPVWKHLEPIFDYSNQYDRQVIRRYPSEVSARAWDALLQNDGLNASDSGWVRDVLKTHQDRIESATGAAGLAFRYGATALRAKEPSEVTLSEWMNFLGRCDPFDPRRSEWTALEIIRQIIVLWEESLQPEASSPDAATSFDPLDRIHPDNFRLPRRWIDDHAENKVISWQSWSVTTRRHEHLEKDARRIESINVATGYDAVVDYRYGAAEPRPEATTIKLGGELPPPERHIRGLGRLLLTLLQCEDHVPGIWNLRGNERAVPLPVGQAIAKLSISSPTTRMLQAMLSRRSIETRSISRQGGLFGLTEGETPNDTRFDPPPVRIATDLLPLIKEAQSVLADLQIAVSRNQPRQLIPFRLADFAALAAELEEDVNHQGDGDGG